MRIAKKNMAAAFFGIIAVLIVMSTLVFMGSRINTRVIPKGTIEISTPYNKYLVGEEIKFTISNNFNSTISFKNTCPTEPLDVYRYENNKWNRLHATTDKSNCSPDDRTITIPANSTKEASLANWQGMFDKPGSYRIVAYVDYYGLLPYSDFEIIEKPIIPTVPIVKAPSAKTTTKSTATSAATPANTSSTQPANSTTSASAAIPTPTPTPARTSKSISISEGTINVEYTSTYIYVISIQPASGYTYEGGRSGSRVEITFKRNGDETQIKLSIRNGQLNVAYD